MELPDRSAFIAHGASAEVFRLDAGRVLKLFHDGIDPGIVKREFEIVSIVQATGLPVARAVAMDAVAGRPAIIYSELRGPNLLAYMRRYPLRIGWAQQQMAALHRRIHEQAVPMLRSRKHILAEDIAAADIDPRLADAAFARLEQLVEGDRLSHGDLHPANLVVTDTGLGVIDWSKAARAAPAADIVRTEMLMRFGPGQTEQWWAGAARDILTTGYVRRYCKLARMDEEALTAWRALVALGWMRHRLSGRDEAFDRYLDAALAAAGFPPMIR